MQQMPADVGGRQPSVAQDVPPVSCAERQLPPVAGKHGPEVTPQRKGQRQRSAAAVVQRVSDREPLLDANGSVRVPLAQRPALILHLVSACSRVASAAACRERP